MASNIPVVKQAAWISIIPQIGVMILLFGLYYLIGLKEFILYGTLTYLLFSYSLRVFVPKSHRKGIKLMKEKKFEIAILNFENSYNFFVKNNWIDKYRYLTLLSSSKMTYREMALCNIAFCYGQIGNGKMMKEYYKKTLVEFPENSIAYSAIKAIDSLK